VGLKGNFMTIGEMPHKHSAPRQASAAHSGMDAVTARGHFAIFTPTQARGEQLRPEIRLEQMRMLVESQKLPLPYAFPLLMVPYAACFLSFIAWYWLSVPVVLVLLANWFHRSVLHAFVKAHPDPADIEKWEYRFIAAGFLLSLSLASTSIFLWVPDDAVQQSFVLTALLVTLAPMALLTSCYMPSFYATVIPIAAAAAIRLVTSGELLQIGLAAILVVFTAFLAQLCTKVNGIMLHSITLREDKTGLIDQLFAAKRESDAARARAEEASRAKSHFLANMSHELRTPLNAIIGFSEVMASEIFGKHANPTYKEYANDINRSGQHLLGLINDVLDLSRIEAGRFQITEEDVSITELAEDSRRILEIRAQAQHVTIVEDYEPGLPVVHGDARALRQTWINLLTNAIKFSPPGSDVRMFIRMDPNGELRFGVHDNGPGIAETEIEKVLHAFTQGASGLAQPGKGSGLGLSIVKGLMDIHGGSFELKSQLGAGTQAECTLPPQRLRPFLPEAKRA
tara:strand:- start:7048 stop:8580 length:1533 start_codon:yes stop_codon:yes gene_type:complete